MEGLSESTDVNVQSTCMYSCTYSVSAVQYKKMVMASI